MYGEKNAEIARCALLDSRITLIPFAYDQNATPVPHRLTGMTTHLKEVIVRHKIDLVITASPGYAHYPWNVITEVPIVLLNIFGAPTLQKNIVSVIYNSETTRRHAEVWIGKDSRADVMYAPLFNRPPQTVRDLGSALRKHVGIASNDFVFGRIGRDSDADRKSVV